MSANNLTYTRCILNDSYWSGTSDRVKKSQVYNGSHRGEEGNEVGFLGEIVAEAWFKRSGIKFKDDRDKTTHDYTFENGMTVDVKTKDRTVIPRYNYDNSVPLYNHSHQRPDYYLFVSLLRDKNINVSDIRRYKEAFIVGALDIDTLDKIAKVWKKGEVDPANGTEFWTDCKNVQMNQLIPLSNIIDEWMAK